MKISQKAFALILEFEGMDQPGEWPGGASGVTIGRGYDLGYEEHFKADWAGLLPDDTLARLSYAVGVRGDAARSMARRFQDVSIHQDAADRVFANITVPRTEAQTLAAFPGSDNLNPDAFGALVSLVFNRGALVDGSDRRREMKAIHDIIATSPNPNSEGALTRIADQFEAMCRLWPNVRGLRRRRIAEAALIRDDL